MNHFERLVRRAMLRPALRPGSAIVDPFERSEVWPLEATPSVATPAPLAEALPPIVPPQAAPLVSAATSDTALAPVVDSTIAPATTRELSSPDPIVLAPPLPVVARRDDEEPGLAPPPIPPLATDAAALAHADAFLHSLGVRVPDLLSERAARSVTLVAERAAEREDSERPARRSSQLISPPASPHRVAIAAAPPSTLPPDPGDGLNQRRERVSEPEARGRAAVVRREILLVDRAVAGRDHGGEATAGVGSPHIGLGQL